MYKKIFKKGNHNHAPAGSSKGGQFISNAQALATSLLNSAPSKSYTNTLNFRYSPDLVRHSTRYEFAVEGDFKRRIDLGHFKDRNPRQIESPETINNDALWHGTEKTFANALSEDERKAIIKYTGPGMHSKLNKAMATGKTNDPDLFKLAHTLNSAIHKTEIPEDITLFRGMTARGELLKGADAIGQVYDAKTFHSTSLLQDNAIQFAAGREPSVIMKIKVKKGQKGAFTDGLLSANPIEQEVILPPQTKFLITGHSVMTVKMGKATQQVQVFHAEAL